jgi:hypothetical protein
MDWDKIKQQIKEGAAHSIEKIEELSKIGKLKVDEMTAKRKIHRNFADIGERAFDLIGGSKGKDIEADLTVKKSINNIKSLRQEIVTIQEKIQAIKEAAKKAHTPDQEDDELTGV